MNPKPALSLPSTIGDSPRPERHPAGRAPRPEGRRVVAGPARAVRCWHTRVAGLSTAECQSRHADDSRAFMVRTYRGPGRAGTGSRSPGSQVLMWKRAPPTGQTLCALTATIESSRVESHRAPARSLTTGGSHDRFRRAPNVAPRGVQGPRGTTRRCVSASARRGTHVTTF